jgi:WD40 repeat protein
VGVIKIYSSEVRVWTLGGDLVYTLSGHTSFVYSLSVLPNGDVISGGEDRTVRVWKGQDQQRNGSFFKADLG